MWPANDKSDARQNDEAAMQSEPAAEGIEDPRVEPSADADEGATEEAGYGYGV